MLQQVCDTIWSLPHSSRTQLQQMDCLHVACLMLDCCWPAGELHLTLQRLVIAGSKLTAANGQNGPPFWPLGLYDTVGTGLNISDVRLVVDAAVLQDYLALMQTLPRAVAQYYTVSAGLLFRSLVVSSKFTGCSCGRAKWDIVDRRGCSELQVEQARATV